MVERLSQFGRKILYCGGYISNLTSHTGRLGTSRCRCERRFLWRSFSRTSCRAEQPFAPRCLPGRHQVIPLFMGQPHSSGRRKAVTGSILRAQDRDAVLERDDVGTLPSGLWIIVGLGNPGPKFAGNRHNVGFMTVDRIAKREGILIEKKVSRALVGRCNLAGQSILLAKPLTYMNLSGESVGGLAKFYKVPIDRIVVIYDDLDTPLASVKLKEKGGHGGHNGIRSLNQHLKGNFPRIKIGVGRPPGNRSVIDHVLQDFTAKEKEEIDFAIDNAIKTLESVFTFGMQRAVSGMRI